MENRMRRNGRFLFPALLAAAGMLVGTGGAAVAQDVAADDGVTELVEPTTSLIATPEELAALGFAPKEVAAQREIIDSLTPAQLEQQNTLRREQDAIGQGLQWEARQQAMSEPISPMSVSPSTCGINEYHVRWYDTPGSGHITNWCYTGTGVIDVSIPRVHSLKTGNVYGGRVLYHQGSGTYWSLWRPPSQTVHEFNPTWGKVTVYKVELAYYV